MMMMMMMVKLLLLLKIIMINDVDYLNNMKYSLPF